MRRYARSTGSTPGWAKSDESCQFVSDGTPSHADIADVRPRLPLLATPLALLSRRGSVKTRRPELLALKHEVVRRAGILATAAEDHRDDAMALAGLLDMDQVRARLADDACC